MADVTYQPKVYRKQGGDSLVVASGGLVTVESGGSIVHSGGAVTSSALQTIGTVVTATGADISTNTGRVAGLQVNLQNTAATVTGFRAIDARVTDAGGTGANVVALQGVATHSSGTSTGELWGTNSIAALSGGQVENVYGVVGEIRVTGTAAIGTAGRPDNYVTAGLFLRDVASTSTEASATVDAAVLGVLVGNNSNSAIKSKADGIFVGIIGGDSATVTGGAGFKLFRHNSIAASVLDYGVDLYSSEGGGYIDNAFATADIRLAAGMVINSVTTAVSDNDATTLPASSLVVTSHNTGKGKLFISDGSNLQVVTTT